MGRPKVDPERQRKHRVTVYLAEAEYKELQKLALRCGMTPSEYTRVAIVRFMAVDETGPYYLRRTEEGK